MSLPFYLRPTLLYRYSFVEHSDSNSAIFNSSLP